MKTPANCHPSPSFLRAILSLLLAAQCLRAVSFVGSIRAQDLNLVKPFGDSSFSIVLDYYVDGSDLPDDEYDATADDYTIQWSVQGGPGGNGNVAEIRSSPPNGTNVIPSPGNYTITFSGELRSIRWRRNGEWHTTQFQTPLPLVASTGGTLSTNFTLVGVASVSCEGVTSITPNPGVNETLVVPVGYNNGSLTLTATPAPAGSWPYSKPVWNGAAANAQNAATATLSTSASGTYNVSATCGNTVGLTVQVIGVSGLTARRKGSGDSFGASATIAAGGKASDVHKAEIRIQLSPIPLKQASLAFPASLSGAAAHQGTNVAAVLTCGASTLTGDSSGTVNLSAIDISTGTASAELRSSNIARTCTVSIGGSSINVGMTMAALGNRKYDWPAYFIYGISHDIDFFPTLQEAADDDADGDGTAGEGAISGHDIRFYIKSVTIRYWSFDWENFEYIDYGEDDIDASIGEDPLLRYNLRLSDIMDFGDTSETLSGQYTDTETVYGFYDYDDSTCVETCLEVETYLFAVYDADVYNY